MEIGFLEEIMTLVELKVYIILLLAICSSVLIKRPPCQIFLEILDTKMVTSSCKNCNKLPSNYSLSRFCCQNYFLSPNTYFRSCFARL